MLFWYNKKNISLHLCFWDACCLVFSTLLLCTTRGMPLYIWEKNQHLWSRDYHWESVGCAFLGQVSDKSPKPSYLSSAVQIYVVDVSVSKPSISNIVLINLSNNKRPFLHNLRRTGSSQIVEGLKWTSKLIKLLNEMSLFFSSVIISYLVPTYSTMLHGIPPPPRHLDIGLHMNLSLVCPSTQFSRIARFAENKIIYHSVR